MKAFLLFLACGLFVPTLVSATTLQLVYGQSWQRAGRDVRKMLESQKWKSLARSQFKVEFATDEADAPAVENRDARDGVIPYISWKLPCIFLLDDRGRRFCVIENVPYNATPEWLFRQVNKVNLKRIELEKKYETDTAEGCGELMFAMEKYVGGPRRVISPGFYKDIYEKLEKLDPKDESGWIRHFTMPFTNHEGKRVSCRNSDGVEIVEEATWYRKEGKLADGEAFIEAQRKLPAKHLTLEQKQSLLMAKFALYAPDDMNKPWTHAKRDEMIELLNRIAEADDRTLWGTAALGWLASKAIGNPALSTYWGWRKNDIPTGRFETVVKYGVPYSFSRPGEYTISFDRIDGANVTFENVILYRGDEAVVELKRAPFVFNLDRTNAGRLTKMVLKGTSGGPSTGKFRIERTILKPRKEGR